MQRRGPESLGPGPHKPGMFRIKPSKRARKGRLIPLVEGMPISDRPIDPGQLLTDINAIAKMRKTFKP